ncbi:MAG: LuxR C-terminal-related transcriptional regulator [Syntrophorhabdales bacterium]|jgi:DNA-binding NarL/FixJ family response regulator
MISNRAIRTAEAGVSNETTVLVMLDNAIMTEGLSELLQLHGYRRCLGTSHTQPDVIIVDTATINDSLTLRYPEAKIFFLQTDRDPARVAALLSWHKVHVIIPASIGLQGFKKALKAVHEGQFRGHHARLGTLSGTEPPAPLTGQEKRVIASICRGDTIKETAQSLQISPHTVKVHVHNIFRKTGAVSRARLVNLLSACCTKGEDHEKRKS